MYTRVKFEIKTGWTPQKSTKKTKRKHFSPFIIWPRGPFTSFMKCAPPTDVIILSRTNKQKSYSNANHNCVHTPEYRGQPGPSGHPGERNTETSFTRHEEHWQLRIPQVTAGSWQVTCWLSYHFGSRFAWRPVFSWVPLPIKRLISFCQMSTQNTQNLNHVTLLL